MRKLTIPAHAVDKIRDLLAAAADDADDMTRYTDQLAPREPFPERPADGGGYADIICPSCGRDQLLVVGVTGAYWRLNRWGDGTTTSESTALADSDSYATDDETIDDHVWCSSCFSEWEMPTDFEWA